MCVYVDVYVDVYVWVCVCICTGTWREMLHVICLFDHFIDWQHQKVSHLCIIYVWVSNVYMYIFILKNYMSKKEQSYQFAEMF